MTNPVATLAALLQQVSEAFKDEALALEAAAWLLARGVQYAPPHMHSGPRSQDCPACQEFARGRSEGPACHGPNSHAEYNSLVATAEDLANENERFRDALEDVALVAGGKAAERIRALLRGEHSTP